MSIQPSMVIPIIRWGIRFSGSKAVMPDVVIETPQKLTIKLHPVSCKKAQVIFDRHQVSPAPSFKPQWVYWYPHKDTPLGHKRLYWTKNYIGTDADFYNAGYRWGVSIGGNHQEFKHSSLYLPGGGINLPNGKYLIAIRESSQGNREIVLGKESRGIDKRLLPQFHQGVMPEANYRNEVLGVSNHSMLISRGKPYDSAQSNPDDYSASFAGEVEIVDHRINVINDQTGQLFGPPGLIKPPSPSITDTDATEEQPTYELDKSAALKYAKETLAEITGNPDMRLVKVLFINQVNHNPPPSEDSLMLKLHQKRAEKLTQIIQQNGVQGLFDQLQSEPTAQKRLFEVLSKNSDSVYAVLDLRDKLIEGGTLKPLQGAGLAVELLETPEAIGLFNPDSSSFIPSLSDNTKRKLITAYNKLDPDQRPDLNTVISFFKAQPQLIRFLSGQRTPGGFLKAVLLNPQKTGEVVTLVEKMFNTASINTNAKDEGLIPLEGDDPELIGHVSTSAKRIKDISKKAKRVGADNLTVLIQNNPFNGTRMDLSQLQHNIRQIQKLQDKGVTIYGDSRFRTNRAMMYLTDLYAYAHPTVTAEDATILQDMKRLFKVYGVDSDDLHKFARDRFKERWGNTHIVAAYALKNKSFKRLLEDLNWVVNLPLATY
jgi:hypothetical protein